MNEKIVELTTETDLKEKFSHLDIVFCVYDTVDGDLDQVTDMTQEIPIKGKAVFVYNPGWYGNRQRYQSEVVKDATYAQIAEFADVARKTVGDSNHRYFEGVDVLYHVEGLSIVEMSFGS